MPGGENQLVKAKLTPGTLTVNLFKWDIQHFADGYNRCFRTLARKDNPYIDKVLKQYSEEFPYDHDDCTKDGVIKTLGVLNQIVIPHKKWFERGDVALLCAKVYDHHYVNLGLNQQEIQDYETYSSELQDLLSTLGRYLGTSVKIICDKLGNMHEYMLNMRSGLESSKMNRVVPVPDTIGNYFRAALDIVLIFDGAVRVCKNMGMIK